MAAKKDEVRSFNRRMLDDAERARAQQHQQEIQKARLSFRIVFSSSPQCG